MRSAWAGRWQWRLRVDLPGLGQLGRGRMRRIGPGAMHRNHRDDPVLKKPCGKSIDGRTSTFLAAFFFAASGKS